MITSIAAVPLFHPIQFNLLRISDVWHFVYGHNGEMPLPSVDQRGRDAPFFKPPRNLNCALPLLSTFHKPLCSHPEAWRGCLQVKCISLTILIIREHFSKTNINSSPNLASKLKAYSPFTITKKQATATAQATEGLPFMCKLLQRSRSQYDVHFIS